ncbi:MAG: 1,4-alpha-glucan branching protein GlgB [Alphaproteobacteria bacterium]|nr:MAG: 1,4-alpha-glucan branching protein GlgB [Alphaproteobacteria bacterium]
MTLRATIKPPPLAGSDADALARAIHGDPFSVLGPHQTPGGLVIRALLPGARSVDVLRRQDRTVIGRLEESDPPGLFQGVVSDRTPYLLRIGWPDAVQETEDPYAFDVVLGDLDLHLFSEGRHFELAEALGANVLTIDGVRGVRFAVWAPNASRVAVVGDFNAWDARRHAMRLRHSAGMWELFVPRVQPGARYKYDIIGAGGIRVPLKADPVAQQSEPPPATASVVSAPQRFRWHDDAWMAARAARQAPDAPMSVYEVHLASWMHHAHDGSAATMWDVAIDRLIPYLADMGFTHIELLPITEHPFGGSWGYQPLGLFAPTARYGAPEGFARFVDALHQAGIGIILDWVPAHFPTDPHGLARFDGTALYEHLDPREGFHHDWNTYIYNFGRREVQGFLIASALHWLERFHVDGLRVDAVASMLYRDYSRPADAWVPNVYGGRENLEAVGFLQHLNAVVRERCPGAVMIAEESTAWPGVTQPTSEHGLGFAYKWNMGWMHDTLRYIEHDPVHRAYHHDDMTFGLIYAYSEKFILPLSHDEVVHGKGSLLAKMPGDRWQKFANLRAYFGFMWSHPGKKLLFMGGEIAQEREWNHDTELDWFLLDDPAHAGVQRLVRDLNRVYREQPALHARDTEPAGFRWMVGDDRANSVFAYQRFGADGSAPVLVVCNMTPVPRQRYRIGVARAGAWREIVNTDSQFYGGSNVGNDGAVYTVETPSHGEPQSLELTLPPLATIMLRGEN